MWRWSPALALLGALGCVNEPDYTGRLCGAQDPCPAGYVCAADGRCAPEGSLGDAGPALDAGRDAGLADSGLEPDPLDGGLDAGVPDADPGDAGPPDAGDPWQARCQEPVAYPTSGWQARYFELQGSGPDFGPCAGVDDLPDEELAVLFDVDESPGGGLFDFGVSYTARRDVEAGVHTVWVDYDDGIRFYVDDVLAYEDWVHDATFGVTFRTPYLTAGPHDFRVELFDDEGQARLLMNWVRGCWELEVPDVGWVLSYYALTAQTALDINHCYGSEYVGTQELLDWDIAAGGAPTVLQALGVTDDYVTMARGLRELRGLTHFSARHDDGYRLFVDDVQRMGAWGVGAERNTQGSLHEVGTHELRLEKFDRADGDRLAFYYENVCDARPTLSTSEWWATYYPVIYTVNPESWTLDRGDCLGAEVIASATLSWTTIPTRVSGAGYQDRWGAEYFGDRFLGVSATVNVHHDDGLRVWSGTNLWYESWTAPQIVTDSFVLPPGSYRFRLEYFEHQGGEQLQMTW
ncbi:MAG: hypothetical protein H6730_05420 [Deltaproteobacteria bacterium]|nr:hypothetical protein [Deltaproteobacteria bacterium]